VYIIDNGGSEKPTQLTDDIVSQIKTQIKDKLPKLVKKAGSTSNPEAVNGSIDLTSAINITVKNNDGTESLVSLDTITKGRYIVYYVDSSTSTSSILNNKNRIQFVKTFKTSALKDRRILAFGVLVDEETDAQGNTQNNYYASDNYVDYSFNRDGILEYPGSIITTPEESMGSASGEIEDF
jgi:hypothetical protein